MLLVSGLGLRYDNEYSALKTYKNMASYIAVSLDELIKYHQAASSDPPG
jgi:hypothetical protein